MEDIHITVKNAVGRSFDLQLKDVTTLDQLKRHIAARLSQIPIERLKLIRSGTTLTDDDSVKTLKKGDYILAIVTPKAPSQKTRDAVLADAGVDINTTDDNEDDQLFKLHIPSTAPQWQKTLIHIFKETLHIPEPIIAVLYRKTSLKFWILLILWMITSRYLSIYFNLGPVFLLATIFVLMLVNLGTRTEGSLSAYSIFNPTLQRLPGQLDANDLDRQARAGQL